MDRTVNGVTDQRQTSLESRLRLVIDTIPEQVWTALPDGSVDFLNQRWQEYTGLSLEEGLGLGVRLTVHPEDLPAVLDEWNKSVASGGVFVKEARIRQKARAHELRTGEKRGVTRTRLHSARAPLSSDPCSP